MKLRNRVRPLFETLEDRTVPASVITLDGSGNLSANFGNSPTAGTVPTAVARISVVQAVADEIQFDLYDGANVLIASEGPYLAGGNLSVEVGTTLTGIVLDFDLGGVGYSGNVSLKVGNSPPGFGGFVAVEDGTIGGSLTITTGNGDDAVGLGTGFLQVAGDTITVQGPVNINMNGSSPTPGGDTVSIGAGTFGANLMGNVTVTNANSFTLDATGTVGGSLNANSGSKGGTFLFTLDTGSSVGVNAYITTGNNPNTVGTDSVILNGSILGLAVVQQSNGTNNFEFAGTIGSGLTYLAGSGADSGTIGGTIGTNLTIVQGNGANSVSFNASSVVLGSSISIVGGTGTDLAQFNGLVAPGARLNANMGNGNDTIQFLTIPVLASAYIDGGAGFNSFSQVGTITYPFTKRNF